MCLEIVRKVMFCMSASSFCVLPGLARKRERVAVSLSDNLYLPAQEVTWSSKEGVGAGVVVGAEVAAVVVVEVAGTEVVAVVVVVAGAEVVVMVVEVIGAEVGDANSALISAELVVPGADIWSPDSFGKVGTLAGAIPGVS